MKARAPGEVQKQLRKGGSCSLWLCPLGDRNQPLIRDTASMSAAGSGRTDGMRARASQTAFTESMSSASHRRKLGGCVTGRPHSTALPFTALHFIAFFFFTTNQRFVTTFSQCRFPDSNCSLAVFMPHFGHSHNILNSFIIITCVLMICDQ